MVSSNEINHDIKLTKIERRYDIDWLRIITLFMVYVYHCSRFFDEYPWHIKNSEISIGMTFFFTFLGGIGMPLFFMISGMATFYFLGFAKSGLYIKARFVRLMIPFVFALLTQIPIQVYLDRIIDNEFTGSFFEFYPQYFNGLYGHGGNFPWNGLHLWFLLLLFFFSIITAHLFEFLRKEKNLQKMSKMSSFFKKKGSLYLLIVPLFFVEIFQPLSIFGTFGGYNMISLFIFYLIGFYFATSEKLFKKSIEDHAKLAWIIGIISMCLIPVVIFFLDNNEILFWILGIIYAWSFLLIILGWGSKHLNRNHKSRKFLNEIAMPFYIVHQTIIIIIGYFVVQTSLSIFLKYLIILTSSFIIIVPIVLIIRKINVLRFLFGMSIKKEKKP